MQPLALKIIVLWGWRRLLVAFLAGVLSSLSLAPFHMFPIFMLTFSLLVWLLDGLGSSNVRIGFFNACTDSIRRLALASLIGWCFGFGYFLASFHWIGFIVADAMFLPVRSWLLAAPLSVFLAVSTSLGTVIACLLWSSGWCRIFALAVGLTIGEWLRGKFFINFPLNDFGASFASFEPLMQAASIVGIHGLTFLCVLIFSSPGVVWVMRNSPSTAWQAPVLGSCLLAVITVYGFFRLPDSSVPIFENMHLRLVQLNETQWEANELDRILADYLKLSSTVTSPSISGISDVTHLIWPGIDMTLSPSEKGKIHTLIADFLPPDTMLLTGWIRVGVLGQNEDERKRPLYDSLLIFDDAANILAFSDRVKPFPFSDFRDFRSWLDPLDVIFLKKFGGNFVLGSSHSIIAFSDMSAFIPLIRDEAIFSFGSIRMTERPHWILNTVGQSLSGDSVGMWQYFHQLRLRAVEQGLPLVRSANSGISAVIDPYGRVISSLPPNSSGVLDVYLPQPLPATVFARFGDWILISVLICGIFFSMFDKWFTLRSWCL